MHRLQLTPPKLPLWNSLPTHMEARERLNYVAECHGIGLLTGTAGTGKSRLFREVQGDLEKKGAHVVLADVSGWDVTEFAIQISVKLQLGLSLKAAPLEVWTRIEQWTIAMRQLHHRHIILLDHLERSVDCHRAIDRLLNLLSGAVACLMTCTDPIPESLKPVIQRHCPLRISLPRLTRQETSRYVAQQALPHLPVSPNGMLAIHELAKGRLRSLDRLGEIIENTRTAEETDLVDSRLVRESAREVRL